MEEEQLKDTLRRLAHCVVRNEIVCEHFLTEGLPASREEVGAKVREVDAELTEKDDTRLRDRFPRLFPES